MSTGPWWELESTVLSLSLVTGVSDLSAFYIRAINAKESRERMVVGGQRGSPRLA